MGSSGGSPTGASTISSTTVEDPATFQFIRTVFNGAGSDLWKALVNGNRTGYANERGELRSRAYDATSVAFRCQSNVSGNNTSVNILEATLSDNTVKFAADANGNATVTNNLVLGGSITGAGGYSTFTDITPATNVLQGTPHLQFRTEPGGLTRLQGQLTIDTAGVTSGTALNTAFASGARPASTSIYTIRFSGTGAAAALWTISTGGVISCSVNLVSGNIVNFDGITFVHA